MLAGVALAACASPSIPEPAERSDAVTVTVTAVATAESATPPRVTTTTASASASEDAARTPEEIQRDMDDLEMKRRLLKQLDEAKRKPSKPSPSSTCSPADPLC